MAAERGWQRKFDDPIETPDGRALVTLRDAATYVTGLPKREASLLEWQAAIETLMRAAERGWPVMMARISVLLALNRGRAREFNSSRKGPHLSSVRMMPSPSRAAFARPAERKRRDGGWRGGFYSKTKFNGVGGLRTYISFTHLVFK